MARNRATIWGMLVLVVMAAGLTVYRGHLLAEREACGQRLRAVARALNATVPAGTPVPGEAIRQAAQRAVGLRAAAALHLTPAPVIWASATPAPVLWDAHPHPFVNGVHVLYTDGTVRLQATPPTP